MGCFKDAKPIVCGKVLIIANSTIQQENVLKLNTLNGGRVKCHIQGSMIKMRGVIDQMPLEMTMEDVKACPKGGKVIDVKRMKSRKSGSPSGH